MEELVRKMDPTNLPVLKEDSDADLDMDEPVEPVVDSQARSSAE
jgi:hypothetical protein